VVIFPHPDRRFVLDKTNVQQDKRQNPSKIIPSTCSESLYHQQATTLLALLCVKASVGVGSFLDTSHNANTIIVSTRVGHTSRGPNRPRVFNAVWASNKVSASELKVSVLDCPAVPLGIFGGRLSAGGISNLTLTCLISV
jgi:hypothetical protein